MYADQLASSLLISLKEEEDALDVRLRDGGMSDMGEYKHVCGMIAGLRFAANQVRANLKKMSNDDFD